MSTDKSAESQEDLLHRNITPVLVVVCWLFVPAQFINRRLPRRQRYWRWRWVYAGYLTVGLLVFAPALLAGKYWTLVLIPFAHIVAPAMVAFAAVLDGVPHLSFAVVSDLGAAGIYAGGTTLILCSEYLRRGAPELLGIGGVYRCDDDEFLVPLTRTVDKDPNAELPPRFDQNVSTALIGETGAGKTSAMELIAYQLPYDQHTAVIAHDYADDFQQFYDDMGFDVIRIGVEDSDVHWNLFRDIENEREFREIAGALFGEPVGHNPFHGPAKQVFEAVLIYLYREAQDEDDMENLGHHDIVAFLNQDSKEIYHLLRRRPELHSKATHLDPESGKTAPNVYQTLHEHVDPVFEGDFAENGDFSLREYISNPDGRALIIDSQPTEMETLGPMFQLLLDWGIRYALESDNRAVWLLDEIDQLPELTQLSHLTARGRAERTQAVIGVQTIGQLKDTYSDISGVLGNCPQGIYFSPGDSETTEFIQDEVGEVRESVVRESYTRSGKEHEGRRASKRRAYEEKDRTPFTSGTLKEFDTGECVVISRTHWWLGQIELLADIRERLDNAIGHRHILDEDVDADETDADANSKGMEIRTREDVLPDEVFDDDDDEELAASDVW